MFTLVYHIDKSLKFLLKCFVNNVIAIFNATCMTLLVRGVSGTVTEYVAPLLIYVLPRYFLLPYPSIDVAGFDGWCLDEVAKSYAPATPAPVAAAVEAPGRPHCRAAQRTRPVSICAHSSCTLSVSPSRVKSPLQLLRRL